MFARRGHFAQQNAAVVPNTDYHPEPYWSQVASRIDAREGTNVVAGDDEPYYVYKRERFVKLLHELDLSGKSVLEIGPGPGGNLLEIWPRQPSRLAGVDISATMLGISRQRVDPGVELFKTDGTTLPFTDREFDLVFTATVIQHNSDDAMMRQMLAEAARVSAAELVLFEQVGPRLAGTELMMARPVAYYAEILRGHGFELAERKMIDIYVSYLVSGTIRKVFNASTRKEGEALTPLAVALQKATLPITKLLDRVVTPERDLARMRFVRRGH